MCIKHIYGKGQLLKLTLVKVGNRPVVGADEEAEVAVVIVAILVVSSWVVELTKEVSVVEVVVCVDNSSVVVLVVCVVGASVVSVCVSAKHTKYDRRERSFLLQTHPSDTSASLRPLFPYHTPTPFLGPHSFTQSVPPSFHCALTPLPPHPHPQPMHHVLHRSLITR